MNLTQITIGCILAIPLVFGVRNELRLYQSQSWPGIEAEILSSELSANGGGGSGDLAVSAEVSYLYKLKGEYFIGRRISFGYCGTSDYGDAISIISQYPKGSKATIYYDPSDFRLSTLKRERGVGGYLLIFVGCGLVAGWLFLIRKRVEVEDEAKSDFDLNGDPDAVIKRRANNDDL